MPSHPPPPQNAAVDGFVLQPLGHKVLEMPTNLLLLVRTSVIVSDRWSRGIQEYA